jgi:hypothetical protein
VHPRADIADSGYLPRLKPDGRAGTACQKTGGELRSITTHRSRNRRRDGEAAGRRLVDAALPDLPSIDVNRSPSTLARAAAVVAPTTLPDLLVGESPWQSAGPLPVKGAHLHVGVLLLLVAEQVDPSSHLIVHDREILSPMKRRPSPMRILPRRGAGMRGARLVHHATDADTDAPRNACALHGGSLQPDDLRDSRAIRCQMNGPFPQPNSGRKV